MTSLALVAICLSLPSFAIAHEGIHEQIVAVTAEIKRDPKNAALYLRRGELRRLHRDWSRAAADYDQAERLQPSLSNIDLARGKMLFESRRFQRAKLALDHFLRKNPNSFEGLVTRARVFAKVGERIKATHDFTRALELAVASEPELYLERAETLSSDERYIEEALRGLDEGINRLGPLVTLQLSAIDLELRRNNYEVALTRLDLIARQSDRKEMWLVRRGEILKSAGRNEEARAAFIAALAAIESLPAERRQTRTVSELQSRARAGLGL